MPESPARVAIVTGAARGIGAATAERLARDGMAMAVLDLEQSACKPTVDKIAAGGGQALAVGADVADAEQVEASVARVASELSPFGVTVNAVVSGFIVTDMTAATAARMGVDFELMQQLRPRPSRRPPGGRRQPHRLSGRRGRVVRVRPGDLRHRRPTCLTRSE
jgi:NAD(P)-dependent dehydrogenase (short-subunit alcohol dehydrogenase family)